MQEESAAGNQDRPDMEAGFLGQTLESIRQDLDEEGVEWTVLVFVSGHQIQLRAPGVFVFPPLPN